MEQISTSYVLEIHDLSLRSDLDPASYMVKGPDKNLPVEYDQRWINLHGSMQCTLFKVAMSKKYKKFL